MRALLMLLLFSPLAAQQFDIAKQYDTWLAAEQRFLLGRDTLTDNNLIEHLEPLAGLPNAAPEDTPKDWRASALLGLGYLYGTAGAPQDTPTANRYFLRAMRASKDAAYIAALSGIGEQFPHYNPWKGQAAANDFFRLGRMPGSLKTLAANGNVPAQAVWGQLTLMQNPEDATARASLKAAADAGCLPAKVWASWWMTFDSPPDFEAVREQLTAAAKDGYAPAAFALGRLHEPGDKMLPDLPKSREWYAYAHDLGDWDALFALKDLPPKPLNELTLDELWEQYISEPSELFEFQTSEGVCWLRRPSPVLRRYRGVAEWLDGKIAEMPEPPRRPEQDFTRAHILRAEVCLLFPPPANATKEFGVNRQWGMEYLQKVPDNSPLADTLCSDYRFLADDAPRGNDLLWKSSHANEQAAQRRTYGAAVAEQWAQFAYFGKNSVAGVREERALPPLKEALDHLRKLAMAGDHWAARLMAKHYRHASNFERCIHWNSLAANFGDGGACIELAEDYLTGEHIPRDLKLAQQWADKGMRIRASHAYIRDHILPKLADPDGFLARKRKERMDALQISAVKEANRTGDVAAFLKANPRLAREAAQSGDPLLALCYLLGHGVLADRQRAIGLVRSGEGGAVALYVLARIYETAEPPDHSGAVVCYDSAVAAGHAFGMLGRARHLQTGNAIKKDEAAAAELFKQAAEAGCLPAMVEYAKCLRDGTGVEADKAEARKWAQKAADEDWQAAKQLLKELEQ